MEEGLSRAVLHLSHELAGSRSPQIPVPWAVPCGCGRLNGWCASWPGGSWSAAARWKGLAWTAAQ